MKFEIYKNEKLFLGEKEMNFLEFPLVEKHITLEELKNILIQKRNKYNEYQLNFIIKNINNKNDLLLNMKNKNKSIASFLKALIKKELYLLIYRQGQFQTKVYRFFSDYNMFQKESKHVIISENLGANSINNVELFKLKVEF